jgi:hypothetical protein
LEGDKTSDQAHPSPDPHPSLQSITEIIDQVVDIAQTDRVTLRKVLHAVGDASFAPILLLPALAVATPLSGIPLFSSLMGIVIFLIAAQMLLRREHLWLPDWVLRRDVKGKVVRDAFRKLYPVARWLDAHTHSRLRVLVHRPFIFVPQLLCLVSGALMPLLEFVPFSSSIMGVGVALLALGMLTRDGVVTIIGVVPYMLVGWLIVY